MNDLTLFEIPPKTYHNTILLEGEELKTQKKKANGLASAILDFFQRHPGYMYNAEMVWKSINLPNVPLWSVRARISDLTKAGKLIRLKQERTLGSFGHTITFYTLTSCL